VQIPYAAEQANNSDEQGHKSDDQGIESPEHATPARQVKSERLRLAGEGRGECAVGEAVRAMGNDGAFARVGNTVVIRRMAFWFGV
jgi:hypothetical protein